MDINKLRNALDNIGISRKSYSLNGEQRPNTYILEEVYERWRFFYFNEKGEYKLERWFNSEKEACEFLLNTFIDERKDHPPTKTFNSVAEAESYLREIRENVMNDVKNKIESLAEIIEADSSYLPSIETARYDGHAFISEVHGCFHYVVQEGNEEYKRLIFCDTDELLYEVFKGVTFQMATGFELENRNENRDSRRIIFQKQKELLIKLNSNWGDKIEKQQKEFLRQFPYNDLEEE